MEKESVINKVFDLRTKEGLTQENLANELNISRQTVIAIEKGNYIPSVFLALKISKFFKLSVEKIFSISYDK